MAVVSGGSKCNLITGYTEFEDADVEFGKHHWIAQTFTLLEENVIFRCRFKTWTWAPGEFWYFSIRATDATGKPTGPDLATTQLSPTGATMYSPGKWRRFDFSGFPKFPAGVYALLMWVPTATASYYVLARADATEPQYAYGKAWKSTDSGVNWSEVPNTDLMFEVWGYQPPPEPPPPPSISNWAPVNYVHTPVIDGFTIVVTTDIPCHLFMRWTDKEPLKHPSTLYRRGILVPWGTRFCFVSFTENEQDEPGDTLTHTFTKRNWPVCQTRWFYFIGTVQCEEQPSATPIFHVHRQQEDVPMQYGPIWGTTSNRTIQKSATPWTSCHDAATGTILAFHAPPWYWLYVWERYTVSWWLRRSYLFFDTSGIPVGSTILEAKLSLWVYVKAMTSSEGHPHICITQGVQSDPVITANFGGQLPMTVIGGWIHIGDIILDQHNDIEFNDAGLNFIVPGGVTRLCMRGEQDVKDIIPPLGSNEIQYYSAQALASKRPLLTVWYLPP